MVIVFEGLHGCGKSTQIEQFIKFLKQEGFNNIVLSTWNSHALTNSIVEQLKLSNSNEFSIMLSYALDFNLRIQDLKKLDIENSIIIFDRYYYTELARGISRGLPEKYVYFLYKDYIEPSLIFYFNIDVAKSVDRILNGKEKRSQYITGSDRFDTYEYFSNQKNAYEEILKNKKNVFFIDANLSIKEQSEKIKNIFLARRMEND